MPMDFLSGFGDYDYSPANGVRVLSVTEPQAARLRVAPTPGYDDEYAADSLAAPVKFTVGGLLKSTPGLDDLRDLWDAFRAAHAPGPRRPFRKDSDRYRMAQAESVSKAERGSKYRDGSVFEFEVTFTGSPYEEAADPVVIPGLLTGAGSALVTVAGTAPTPPAFTLTVASVAAGDSFSVTAGGRTLTLYPPAAGDYTLDAAAERATDGAGVDVTYALDGAFPRLPPGGVVVALALGGALGITGSLGLTFRPRFY